MDKLTEVLTQIQCGGLDARLDLRDETPLIWAVSEGYSEIALALIEAGAELDAQNSDGNTALLRSACEGRDALASALIEAGAALDVQNHDGYSALILAARRGNATIALALAKAGADQGLVAKTGASFVAPGISPKVSLRGPRDAGLEEQIVEAIRAARMRLPG
jgi:ankyrin repeat protein